MQRLPVTSTELTPRAPVRSGTGVLPAVCVCQSCAFKDGWQAYQLYGSLQQTTSGD